MASNTRKTWKRRVRKHATMGKKRKAVESKRSTPSAEALFAELGTPGKDQGARRFARHKWAEVWAHAVRCWPFYWSTY